MKKRNLTGPFVLLIGGALCWFWGYASAEQPRLRPEDPDADVGRLESVLAELQSKVEALELRSLQRSETASRTDVAKTDERARPEDRIEEVRTPDSDRTQRVPESILAPVFDADRVVSLMNTHSSSQNLERLMRAGLLAPILTRFLRGEWGPTEMQHRSRALQQLLEHLQTLHQIDRGLVALDEFGLSAGWSTTQIVLARFRLASELQQILELGEQLLATGDPHDRYNAYSKMVFALRRAGQDSRATSLLQRGLQDLEAAGQSALISNLRNLVR